MDARKPETRYGPVAQSIHWLMAFMLAGSFSLGFYMHDLPVSPRRLELFSYHKWLGVLAFTVVALRLAWRWTHRPPPLPSHMPAWQKRAAEITHRFLYLLLFAAPLSGWLMSSAKGFQTVLFGVLPIPDLLSKNPPLGAALTQVHKGLIWMLLGLIGLHTLAALKHHFIDRDDVLTRMLPLLLLFLFTTAAGAAVRPVDVGKSEIGFSVKQMGVAVSGRFRSFSARIDLDPAKPESSSAEVKVDVASIDTGTEEGDETARDKPWLDAAGFPQATFKSSSVRALTKERYEIKGTLAIRGKPREITVPLTLTNQPDGSSVATGEFQIRRTDFGVGGGEWNEGDLVGNDVPVHFRLILK